MMPRICGRAIVALLIWWHIAWAGANDCPPSETILPCRCSQKGSDIQIWCSHSNLPQILEGIKEIAKTVKRPIDEFILENNQLPSLPGRFLAPLQIVRLMLRNNNMERLSTGWLTDLERSLMEIFIVERNLRSIPLESLIGFNRLEAITIQSEQLKRLPDFSGLISLKYLSVQSDSLIELPPQIFRHLPKLQTIHINGGKSLNRLEAGLFDNLPSLKMIDLSKNGINWIHLRALYRLPSLNYLKLSDNQISDVGMVGRVIKDLENLMKLKLDRNLINVLNEGSFVDLRMLGELYLNDNHITEIQYGSFHRTPNLRLVFLQNNRIKRIHPESFLQSSGSGVEFLYLQNNEIDHIEELRSLLDALPALKFLDMSNNFITEIPFGVLRGHGTLEQLHLDNNAIRMIDRDALMAMPALRELRLRNNSLTEILPAPFWNLPGLKGLDLALNQYRQIEPSLLHGIPSLRRLDLSQNYITSLDPLTFLNTPMLETLNISFNYLQTIDPITFQSLDRLFEVDASYNQLDRMIPGLPKIVERISVRGNQIQTLPVAATKVLNLPNVRMLDMSHNQLDYIPKFTFQSMNQLRVLSLANNKLRAIEDSTFLGANKLELLHLQDNEISQIQDKCIQFMGDLRDFNIQGNKIDLLNDNLFLNSSQLEVLDLSRNNIHTATPSIFKNLKSLKYLDLSGNYLAELPRSMSALSDLEQIDVSFNRLAYLVPEVMSMWRNITDIRLSNNQIVEIKKGTLRNLRNLLYLDLSSNEINSLEPGALRNLQEIQEISLADNKLVDLKDHVFENLPNLQAIHLQHNLLRFISPEAFFNSPSLVYLNLSSNHFRTMENVGVRSMRNLEVLDITSNALRKINTMPLQVLNWLVELKLDDNNICKVQGQPFDNMPRLRVLSMRNNRMKMMTEKTFKNLRGNIAIFDIDGNPVTCSCEMFWLSVWLDETKAPMPGPMCQNGRYLRSVRLENNNCVTDSRSSNHLPLMNEHGDIFLRQINEEIDDNCDDEIPQEEPKRPLPGESEYFYDQYIDFPGNDSTAPPRDPLPQQISTRPTTTTPSSVDLNNTLLNYNLFKNPRPPPAQQSSSPFTFFGYPLPSLFGRKSDARAVSGFPPTRGKVRMYRPSAAELEKYLNQQTQFPDITARNRFTELSSSEGSSPEAQDSFRTSFKSPAPEKGGFAPFIPGTVSGFIPISNPYETRNETTEDQIQGHSVEVPIEKDETPGEQLTVMVPVATKSPTTPDVHATVKTTTPSFIDEEETPRDTIYTLQDELVSQITTQSTDNIPRYSQLPSTPETILLIPPTSEIENVPAKRYQEEVWQNHGNSHEEVPVHSRPPTGKSTITKVFTPQSPQAEEYFRTTTHTDPADSEVQSNEVITTKYIELDDQSRKHGMEWYYENYKSGGDGAVSSDDSNNHNGFVGIRSSNGCSIEVKSFVGVVLISVLLRMRFM
ncbi:unnamed protein product [Hermetia illucens]|uniref:Chaoptin n=1 Tax=Hermetia illucens TaxID=343691 RepID=A0A7R8UHU0_HERIL|nr:protein artichoke [Hermetia illucens]CAD7081148.1 unnamed protein product [Hermetia illucens]